MWYIRTEQYFIFLILFVSHVKEFCCSHGCTGYRVALELPVRIPSLTKLKAKLRYNLLLLLNYN